MEENLNQENSQTAVPAVITPTASGNWWKMGILVVGILLAGSIAFAGWQFSQKQTPLSLSVPVVQLSPAPVPDPTANWKTYRNEKYKFTFKYPDNDSFSQEPIGDNNPHTFKVTFIEEINEKASQISDGYIFQVALLGNAAQEKAAEDSAKQMRLGSLDNCSAGVVISEIKQIVIANKIGYNYEVKNCYGTTSPKFDSYNFYVFNNGLVYELVKWYTGDTNVTFSYSKILDQILSTFKFLE